MESIVGNRIVFTGGGSAGHVTPNIAIINELNKRGAWDIHYIGSKQGIEKELITKQNIPYYGISSGKLRRYIDIENIKDMFRVLKGCVEARKILKRIKPNLVFSKGGFVSVPVIVAAKSLGIPIFIHESDITPGLANKIAQKFATKIFTTFEEAKQFFPKDKVTTTGSPIRAELLQGSKDFAYKFLGFDERRPILTIMGGSLGAKKINETVRANLPKLAMHFQIVHLCGKNNIEPSLAFVPGYKQYEYIHEELPHILAATDLVITRGGSNAIFEFLALRIPMLIIPLGLNQSRGDQIMNAEAFQKRGYGFTLMDEELNGDTLVKGVEFLKNNSEFIRENMALSTSTNAIPVLLEEIYKITGAK